MVKLDDDRDREETDLLLPLYSRTLLRLASATDYGNLLAGFDSSLPPWESTCRLDECFRPEQRQHRHRSCAVCGGGVPEDGGVGMLKGSRQLPH